MTSRRPVVSVYLDVARRIERRARMSPSRETGGVLIGIRADEGLHVLDVLEIRDAQATGIRYVLRKQAADAALAAYFADVPGDSPVGYVGLWHTHLACAKPCLIDRGTIRREAAAFSGPVALLVMARCGGGWRPFAYLAGQPGRHRIAAAELDYRSDSSGNGRPSGREKDGST